MPKPTLPSRGPQIHALREALSLTQQEFADRCGIDRVQLSKVENGRNKVTSAAMRTAIARAAGVTERALDAYLEERITVKELFAGKAA